MTKQRPDGDGELRAGIGDLPRLHLANGSADVAGGAPIGGDPASAADFEASPHGVVGSNVGACPSITHPQTRQVGEIPSFQSVFNFDWWESAGCVVWDRKSNDVFDELHRYQYQAEEHRQPIACSLGDGQILVHPRGMGSGHSSRLEIRLEWCGATIGLSARNEATRQLSNFYLKIPGETCLVHGFDEVRNQVLAWLEEWGGFLQDEWIRRLDFCLDVPGLNLHEVIFPACQSGQYLSTVRKNSFYRDGDRVTGFETGSGSTAQLVIYDKLAEVLSKHAGVYARAMIERRWAGTVPDSAARVEYRFRSEFLRQFGLTKAKDVMARISDIVERLIQTELRPFFMLTDAVPDRKGRHQGRVDVLPQWAAIVAAIRTHAGQPRAPVKRLERQLINVSRCLAQVVGYLTSATAQMGQEIEGKEDLVNQFRDMLECHSITDDAIRLKWEDKARRYGTFSESVSFGFGDTLAA